jgi:hypothetical protein
VLTAENGSSSTSDLFAGFDAAQVAAIRDGMAKASQQRVQSRACRAAHRHHMRRANAEAVLADMLPPRVVDGDTWHVMSRGDIDALSYVRHFLAGISHVDLLVMSTWCIARADLEEIGRWLDCGRVEQFDLYAGEIFPSQYGDEYELMLRMRETYGCRMVIARNHSKVTLMANESDACNLVIESSANVNTNPRIEQSAIHASADLLAWYLEFFRGLRSIDRHS